jgi:predicted GNAT family acetyltransferase
MTDIKHRHEGEKGIFYIDKNGQTVGRLTYYMPDAATMLINSTWVTPPLRGQNLAYKLVIAATDFAREQSFKIIPACWYVKVVCDRSDSLKGLLK